MFPSLQQALFRSDYSLSNAEATSRKIERNKSLRAWIGGQWEESREWAASRRPDNAYQHIQLVIPDFRLALEPDEVAQRRQQLQQQRRGRLRAARCAQCRACATTMRGTDNNKMRLLMLQANHCTRFSTNGCSYLRAATHRRPMERAPSRAAPVQMCSRAVRPHRARRAESAALRRAGRLIAQTSVPTIAIVTAVGVSTTAVFLSVRVRQMRRTTGRPECAAQSARRTVGARLCSARGAAEAPSAPTARGKNGGSREEEKMRE